MRLGAPQTTRTIHPTITKSTHVPQICSAHVVHILHICSTFASLSQHNCIHMSEPNQGVLVGVCGDKVETEIAV